MPNVVLNASTLIKGGAIQACVAFIKEALKTKHEIDWFFIISSEIEEELQRFHIQIRQHKNTLVAASPARNRKSRALIKAHVERIAPDAVFTFFGPSYVVFQVPHLLGVADPWITHATWLAIRKKGGVSALIRLLGIYVYKRIWYQKADRWVVEAECAKKGMVKRMGQDAESISVVPNTCGDHYRQAQVTPPPVSIPPTETEHCQILVFSSYYPHKRLEIIPYVALQLKKLNSTLNFSFVITIKKNTPEEKAILGKSKSLGVDQHVQNIGPVPIKEGPKLYAESVIMFMPTLLETFSAVYPEAMISNRPIVTSDLDFAHSVCKNAAIYFDPLSPLDAARKINQLITSPESYANLVDHGQKVIAKLPNQEEKYLLYESILLEMLGKEANRKNSYHRKTETTLSA